MFLFILLTLLLLNCFDCQSQSVEDFINSYESAYSVKKELVYQDTSLVYIPAVMNLVENDTSWNYFVLSKNKEMLWNYLTPALLADYKAIDLNTGDYYVFPMGLLNYHGEANVKIAGPITRTIWYYDGIVMPLITFLRNNRPQYVFWIMNMHSDIYYWIIKDDKLYALLFDKENHSFYEYDAELFLSDAELDPNGWPLYFK